MWRRTRSSPPDEDSQPTSTPGSTSSTPRVQGSPSVSASPLFPDGPQSPTPASAPVDPDLLWKLLDGTRADLGISDEAFNPDMHSPNDMLVDTEEHIVDPAANGVEKDNLTIINPDNLETEAEQLQDLTRADDYEAIKELVLIPLVEEPRVLEDVVTTWEITNWRSLNKKERGPIFQAGGFPWRILLFPFGNNVDQCSIYLEHGFEPNEVPEDWSCCVQFALVLWNPEEPTIFAHHSAHHRFTKEESDWGFTKFLESRRMYGIWDNANRPMIENDAANITVYVRIVEDETGVLWHNFNNYDSKKETGFVGLKNQGATCYLNSLLQSLYFTNAFRKAVYEIPTEHDESMTNSAYTLQRLFYQLQTSTAAVGTNELTKSFGWETRHIFEQQDVQELSRKLMERMEERMKGTKAENMLPQMFSGKIKTYISCINVDYESSRIEDFWDVQLNVSGNKNLQESFQDYIQVEKMEGENQYMAGEQYKLQDANKGVIFVSFPDVLHLQLKRFEYDYMRDTMTKINDRYEFPEVFDAAPYLSEDADTSESWTYQLHGVLVHSGDLNAGHYYAFLKPDKDGWFYKYDDDKVTRATMREVLEDNFGGEYRQATNNLRSPLQRKAPIMRPNSAYMLVYIRQSRVDKILCPVTEQDIPEHLRTRFEEEAAIRETRKREREEQHLYMGVKAILPSTFREHGGTDLASFDANPELDPAAPRFYRTLRSSTVQDLVNRIAEDINEDPRRLRLWMMVNRQNKTTRPDTPMMDTRVTVEESYNKSTTHNSNVLRVWVEVAEEVNAEGDAVWPTYQSQSNGMVVKNDLILLFLKHFDAEAQTLRGVGHAYINKEKKVEEIVPLICKKMGWGEKLSGDDKVMLWEEIKPNMIEALRAKQTLKAAELQDGDIVCFQKITEKKSGLEKRLGLGDKTPEETTRKSDRCEDAREYYDFLMFKRTVKFHAHPTRCDPTQFPPFELVLSAKISYDQLAEKVGSALAVDPTHLRFYTVNTNSGNVRVAVKRLSTNQTLQSILNPSGYSQMNQTQRSDALYFEVLDMSLAELDTKKNVKITWLSEGITKEDHFDILVPKNGIVEDLINGVIKKAQIPDEAEAGKIRVFEVNNHKFFREMSREYPVISINEYTLLVAERMSPEEAEATEKEFINCFHFQNEPSRVHGMPFRFLLKEGETFADTKKRLERRTGLKGKSFEKIKFAVVRRSAYSKVHYLQDDEILTEILSGDDDDFLGLDHVDRTRSMRNGTGDLFLKSPWLGGSDTAKCDRGDKDQNSLSLRAQCSSILVPNHSTTVHDCDCRRRQLSPASLVSLYHKSLSPAERCPQLLRAQNRAGPRTPHAIITSPDERDNAEPVRDDIMSFPGMGGGLPGMSGGGGGNVDPNDPNAVQMQKTIKFMSEMQHNCITKTAMSGVAGFGLGGVFGMFMASMAYDTPYHTAATAGSQQTPVSSLPWQQQLKTGFKDMGARSWSSAKNFGKVGALFTGIECGIEGFRAKNDMTNGVASGCVTGAILARNAGPQAAAVGCVGFAAFSAAIEAWMRQPKEE